MVHHVQPVAWRDLRAIAEIQRASFRRDLAYKWWMLAFFHLLPGVRFFVVRQGDDVAGAIIADAHQGNIRIMNVAVNPHYRQQGVGTALMRAAMKAWPDRNVVLMVQEENNAARLMYERMGFTRSGYHASYYGRGNAGIEMTLKR